MRHLSFSIRFRGFCVPRCISVTHRLEGRIHYGILKLIDVPDQGEVSFGLCVTLIFNADVLLLPLELLARSQPKFFLLYRSVQVIFSSFFSVIYT